METQTLDRDGDSAVDRVVPFQRGTGCVLRRPWVGAWRRRDGSVSPARDGSQHSRCRAVDGLRELVLPARTTTRRRSKLSWRSRGRWCLCKRQFHIEVVWLVWSVCSCFGCKAKVACESDSRDWH